MIYTNIYDEFQIETLPIKIKECIKYTKENFEELKNKKIGDYNVNGIKMIINSYETDNLFDGKIFETHIRNVDVQIILSGEEIFGFNNVKNVKEIERNEEKDLVEYSGDFLCEILMREGDVLIFYPQDVHLSGLQEEEASIVKKIIFKVPINEI